MSRKPPLKRAVFLDRDGTLNRDRGFVHRIEDVELLDRVPEGLRRMAELGYELVIATNQSGIARGYFTEAEMHAFNAALCGRLRSQGVEIAAIYYCPFHPTEGIGPYRRESELRKPRCGMLLAAAREHRLDLKASFAIGDKNTDVLAGRAAGCRTILLRPPAVTASEWDGQPDFLAADLVEAAAVIERTNTLAANAA